MSSRGLDNGRFSERQADTIARLLDAAVDELRAGGYETLSVRSVAGAAGVAPATAYNYFASKEHLVAEVFWRRLRALDDPVATGDTPRQRVTATLRSVATLVADEPSLSAACTIALLGSDDSVRQLRDRIGVDIRRRIMSALGPEGSDDVVHALELAYSGAMLQVGMGHLDYDQMADRLAAVVSMVCT